MHSFSDHIFREYDIRGTVGISLNPADVQEIGKRFGTWLQDTHGQGGCVAVGRDGRLSSPDLSQALIQGLQESGVDVCDIGIGPTPMLYFATRTTSAIAGIMVTGSHNPPQDNGLKFTLKEDPFFGEDIQRLKTISPLSADHPGLLTQVDVKGDYVNRLLKDYTSPGGKRLKIAWDPGNGATGEILTLLKQHVEADHVVINETIDGTFPAHHPDPTVPENLAQLKDVVIQEKCDVGIAFDGDGDRIGILDGDGRIFWGDQLLTVLAESVLQEIPGAKIIADVKSSQLFFETVTRLGGTALMGRTGHSLIKKMMRETGAHLAGEMSGHIFFADRYYGYDDALYTAVRLVNLLQESPYTASELYDRLPKYINTPEIRIDCEENQKYHIIAQIKDKLRQSKVTFSDIDGIRVQREEGWWLLRASNTQAVLVARCEAKTQEDLEGLIEELQGLLEGRKLSLSLRTQKG